MNAPLPHVDLMRVRPPRGSRPRIRPHQFLRWCRRADLGALRAAVWTVRACRRIHRSEGARGLHPPRLPRVPQVSKRAVSAVDLVLWLRAEHCLVSTSVRQAWLAAHGAAQDVVIGVAIEPPGELRAHAWLAGEPDGGVGYEEIVRVPPSRRT